MAEMTKEQDMQHEMMEQMIRFCIRELKTADKYADAAEECPD